MRSVWLSYCSIGFAALSPHQAQSSACPPQGLTLSASGGALGSAWSIDFVGPAFTPGFLALDSGPGPVATPLGTLCLNLAGATTILAVPLGPLGQVSLSGVLPLDTSLTGVDVWLQAAGLDLVQLGALLLSNGARIAIEPPRFLLVAPGLFTPFGGQPATAYSFDLLGSGFGLQTALSSAAVDAVRLPGLGWVAVLEASGKIECYDEISGQLTSSIQLPSTPGVPTHLAATEEGSQILVLYLGTPVSPFGQSSPGALRWYSLPTGTLLATTQLVSGNPTDLLAIPGTSLCFLRIEDRVEAVDYQQGIDLAPIDLGQSSGPVVDWVFDGGVLYTLHGGVGGSAGSLPPGLNGVDIASLQPLHAQPLPFPELGTGSALRLGPAPQGTELLALLSDTASGGARIHAVSRANLQITDTSIPFPQGTAALELSPGKTHWILVKSGEPASPFVPASFGLLMTLDPLTLTGGTVGFLSYEVQSAPAPFPSVLLHRGIVLSGSSAMVLFATDPLAVIATLPLPVQAGTPLVLTN